MPRFVVVRKVDKDFDVENFFEKLHIQSNNKTNRPICGVTEIENTSFNITYAQFENYTDWTIFLLRIKRMSAAYLQKNFFCAYQSYRYLIMRLT